MDVMDLIGHIICLLFLITMPPVSMFIMLVYWIYRYFRNRLPPKNDNHVMTEEKETELRNIIEDIRNGNE